MKTFLFPAVAALLAPTATQAVEHFNFRGHLDVDVDGVNVDLDLNLDEASVDLDLDVGLGLQCNAGELIKLHEGSRKCVYTDSTGHKTIGVGFNLDTSGARAAIEGVGANFDVRKQALCSLLATFSTQSPLSFFFVFFLTLVCPG